jgi:hypothetical protein
LFQFFIFTKEKEKKAKQFLIDYFVVYFHFRYSKKKAAYYN